MIQPAGGADREQRVNKTGKVSPCFRARRGHPRLAVGTARAQFGMNICMSDPFTASWKDDTLRSHLALGSDKCVSYLPIRTVEVHLKLSLPEYLAMIEKAGHRGLVLGPDCCRVNSGAVYAFSERDLEALLHANRDLLARGGWPDKPEAFVRRVAAEWVEEGEVQDVIRRAFGDDTNASHPEG